MGEKVNKLSEVIRDFTVSIDNVFREAVNEKTSQAKISERKEAEDRLYNRGMLDKYTDLTVDQGNYQTFKNIYALQQAYEKLTGPSARTPVVSGQSGLNKVISVGSEFGFSEEDSVFIYNMVMYKKAISNIEHQKQKTMEILLEAEK